MYSGRLCAKAVAAMSMSREMATFHATCRPQRGVDPAVGARHFRIERKRIPERGSPLQAVLPPSAFVLIGGGMGPRRELGECDC